ncbi:hypothetical protein B7P43_G02040 [Cryptotermes secundus]|nr:hypothetical protein B7P43_G02040 [Cryptotermes secundus]
MRGGPISTRHLPPEQELAWKELREFVESNREDMFEHLPPGCRVTVLVFREGDQVNLFRVIENEDGTYSPLSESWSGSSIRNLFAEDEPEEAERRLQENSVTMGKMQELRTRMEKLSLQKKPKKPSARVLSGKRPLLHNRRGTPRPHHNHKGRSPEHIEVPQTKGQSNILQLPPIIKSEINLTSASSCRRHNGGNYLATSSLLQAQNQLQARRNRDVGTKFSDAVSEHDNNSVLTMNKHGRRGSQQNTLPAIVSSSVPLSGSKSTRNSGHLDMKQRQNSEYGHRIGIVSGSCSEKTKSSMEDLSLGSSQGVSVISTPNIAIVEEENDSAAGKNEHFSPPNHIIIPSKEATTFTVSQIHQERIRTPVSSSQNRYRVSQLILDDDRPRTSPDELTQQQKAAQELCAILSDTKWHRQGQQHRVHYSNSQLEMLGDLPVEQRKNENDPKDFLHLEKRPEINLTLPPQPSLIDVTTQSPRYGRRSVMLPSAKKHDRIECDLPTMHHQAEINRDAHSLRQSRRQLPSGQGTLLHATQKMIGELGETPLSLTQELDPQSLPLVSTKKQSTVRSRCAVCRKRLNITNVYTCRCEKHFCATHRYSELHNCTFDYKTDGRKILEQTNPLVTAPKLPKI